MNTAQLRSANGVVGYEEGVRAFLVKSFTYMALALLLTAASAAVSLYMMPVVDGHRVTGITQLVALFATLGLVFFTSIASFAFRSPVWATILFVAYAAFTGYGMAPIALEYTSGSLVRVFFIAACVFGGSAIYGSVTKRDLTAWSGFVAAALFGLLAAMVVNLFLGSERIDYLLSGVGVLLFAGLTAYDIQKLEQLYNERSAKNSEGLAVYGGLTLYLDFLNLFLFLLRLFGTRK